MQKCVEYFKIYAPVSEKTGKYLISGLSIPEMTEQDIFNIKKLVFDSNPENKLNIFSKNKWES